MPDDEPVDNVVIPLLTAPVPIPVLAQPEPAADDDEPAAAVGDTAPPMLQDDLPPPDEEAPEPVEDDLIIGTEPDLPAIETVPDDEEDDEPAVAAPCHSGRVRKPWEFLIPSMKGQSCETGTAQAELQHPEPILDNHDVLIEHVLMTQLSVKAGIKKWKEEGVMAVSKELHQLHHHDTFEPLDPKKLSKEDKKAALESHLFLEQKRDGKIKGHAIAGGDKQCGIIPKEEATSPTVSLEAVSLTAMIDAQEGCNVATVDIPNAFVQTKLEKAEDMVIMRLHGKLAELMVQVAPEICAKHVTFNEKGEMVLCVHLKNALCGIIKAMLLHCCKCCEAVKSSGFELNPFDLCVANKMVKGKQLTICWCIDDLKISHVKPCVVTQLIGWLKRNFESIFLDGSGAMKVC